MALPSPAFAEQHIPLGVQLYTVRNAAEKDLASVLKQVHAIGYEQVELYWNVYTHPAKELRAMISGAGLQVPGGHFNYEGMAEKFTYAKELGVQWMVCPMLPKAQWNSINGFHQAAVQFNKWGKRAREMGMRFAFHNHNYEFHDFGGTTGYDVLLKETDPELVFLEMDCYWITQAGRDPVIMLNQLGKRVRMLHLKDRKDGFPPSSQLDDAAMHFTEVGSGTINWRAILALAQKLQVEHYFVEQDQSDRSPMESIKISYNNLRKIVD